MEKLKIYPNGPWASSYDPMALAKMKAATANGIPGDLTGYDCEKCCNRGVITDVTEDARLITRECDCMDIRRCLWEIDRSGMKKVLENSSFENFRAESPWQKALLERSRAYAQKPEGWLLMCGQSGCGKTHLCSAVCHSLLMAGRKAQYLPWREFVVKIKGLTGEYDRQQEVLTHYRNADVLYIDDLFQGGGTPTAADLSLAFELINHRYNNRLTTVISTEYTPQELVKLYETVGGRILEMAGEHVLTVHRDQTKNHRLRTVKAAQQ